LGKVSRLTHKQIEAAIKRDELREFLEMSQEWVKQHLENVLIGAVVFALLAFGGVYLLKSRSDDAIKASIQLSSADQQFSRAASSGESSAFDSAKAAYEQVRSGYPGKDSAIAAELGLANLLFAQGNLKDAEPAFRKFVSDHADSPLAPLAASAQAACLEASGKIKEAADAYLALAQKAPYSAVTALSYFDAARCMEQLKDTAGLKTVVAGLEKLDSDKNLPDNLKPRLQALKKRV
jgi:predicted negative regulator of RcsB-dependent stress response